MSRQLFRTCPWSPLPVSDIIPLPQAIPSCPGNLGQQRRPLPILGQLNRGRRMEVEVGSRKPVRHVGLVEADSPEEGQMSCGLAGEEPYGLVSYLNVWQRAIRLGTEEEGLTCKSKKGGTIHMWGVGRGTHLA